jgi:hypothetical protein
MGNSLIFHQFLPNLSFTPIITFPGQQRHHGPGACHVALRGHWGGGPRGLRVEHWWAARARPRPQHPQGGAALGLPRISDRCPRWQWMLTKKIQEMMGGIRWE